jgi:4-amino-4-deoxy-L-arabinose transferase-like glycosyltransferase
VYAVAGPHSYTAGLILNALLGTAVVALTGVIGIQLLGRRAGLLAMGLAAVHPVLLITGAGLQLEPLQTTLCLAALAAALHHHRAPGGWRSMVAIGFLLGLAVLAREQSVFFVPPVAWLVWTAGPTRTARRASAPIVVLAVTVLTVVPWTIRNAVELHAFVPVTTSTGFGLVGTFNETTTSSPDPPPSTWMPPYDDPRALEIMQDLRDPTEPRVSSALTEYSLEVMRDDPGYLLTVARLNLQRGFDLDGGDYLRLVAPYLPYSPRLLTPAIVGGWAILALAALGALTRRARQVTPAVWVIPASLLAFMALLLPFNMRYRSLLEPFLLLLASCALMALGDRFGLVAEKKDPTDGAGVRMAQPS